MNGYCLILLQSLYSTVAVFTIGLLFLFCGSVFPHDSKNILQIRATGILVFILLVFYGFETKIVSWIPKSYIKYDGVDGEDTEVLFLLTEV